MSGEIRFIRTLIRRYCGAGRLKIIEPACGTGRVLLPLAQEGHDCTGIDISRSALEYLNARLEKKNLQADIHTADMADFSAGASRYDVAVCTVDSFRCLLTETAALEHLRCVSRHLKKNGIYLLALHLLPQNGYTYSVSRWRDVKGLLDLRTTISVLGVDRRKRLETLSIVYNVLTPRKREKLRYEYSLRTYSCNQFIGLLKKVPSLELAGSYTYYDFDVAKTVLLDKQAEDVMLVLRKVS